MAQTFTTGDIVRRKAGAVPMVVLGDTGGRYVTVAYARNRNHTDLIPCGERIARSGLVLITSTDGVRGLDRLTEYQQETLRAQLTDYTPEEDTDMEDNTVAQGTLFKVKEEPRYGTFLTTDSKGLYVLEMKGGGGVEAFPADGLEEVVPYTIKTTSSRTDRQGHLLSKEGVLSVGDVFVRPNGSIHTVVAVNTKNRDATLWAAGRKLVTEAFDTEKD